VNGTGTLGRAVRSEYTKLCTQRATAALLLAAVVFTVVVGAAAAQTLGATPLAQDPVRLSLAGLDAGQALVAFLAVRCTAGEWETGLAVATFCATPHRHVVLAAKAILIGAATAAIALPAVVGSVLVGHVLLAHAGATRVALAGAPVIVRAILGTVLYAILVALLALGTGAVVGDRTASLGATLGVLYVFPIGAQMVTVPGWQRLLQDVGPMPAGLAIEATTRLSARPIAPWAGLAVLGAWSVGALLAGWVVSVRRDV
jgi:ABC-2 type transport system permease protein